MSVDAQADVASVEWALVAHADVAEAVAMPVMIEGGGEVIRAWVVLQPGVEGDTAAAERLAATAVQGVGHAVSVEVRFVESLPKTRTGKVARWMLEPPTA